MARGGALVFKGDAPKKKSTKKKHSKKVDTAATEKPSVESKQQQQPNHSVLPPVIRLQQRTTAAAAAAQQQQVPTMKEGTGGITTSGTVVTGVGTLFEKELNQGDAIIIGHGESQEMRVVTMRLSNTSCAISSSFRDNCKLPTRFHVIRKPRNNKEQEAQELKEQREKLESTQNAFGTYQGDEFVYRERTEHGNYRIKRGKVDGSKTTRGDLLHMRAQKTSDKYC